MILSIDPGRQKCGWAWVDENGQVKGLGILSREELEVWIGNKNFCAQPLLGLTWGEAPTPPLDLCLVGNGTTSAALVELFNRESVQTCLVDERGTTERAYQLYEQLFPPRGLRRLIPAGLRRPPRPVDDFAAWAIALRYLGK